MGSNKTNIRHLGCEPRNEPRAGRARWRVGTMDRVQSNEPMLVLGQIKLNEPPFSQIPAHHWFRHVAPTNALLQQYVLGAEVPEAPGPGSDYSTFLAVCDYRTVCQYQLDVIAAGTWLLRPASQGVIGGGHWD